MMFKHYLNRDWKSFKEHRSLSPEKGRKLACPRPCHANLQIRDGTNKYLIWPGNLCQLQLFPLRTTARCSWVFCGVWSGYNWWDLGTCWRRYNKVSQCKKHKHIVASETLSALSEAFGGISKSASDVSPPECCWFSKGDLKQVDLCMVLETSAATFNSCTLVLVAELVFFLFFCCTSWCDNTWLQNPQIMESF